SALPSASLVEWDAPDDCPGALDVYRRLQETLRGPMQTLDRLSRVRGIVVRAPDGYRLSLDVYGRGRRRSRVLESPSCDDLADAAAFAIRLALTAGGGSSRVAEERGASSSHDPLGAPVANTLPRVSTP